MKKIECVPDIDVLMMESQNNAKDLELAKKFNDKYLHWEELRYRVEDEDTRRRVWVLMKLARTVGSVRLSIGGIECSFVLTPNISKKLFELERSLSENKVLGGADIGYRTMSFLEESISSSILEGATVTITNAKQMIRKGKKPITTGERMILNNYRAMGNIKKILTEELTPELIKNMHGVIVSDTLKEGKEWEGRFREDNETVVGDLYDPEKIFHIPPAFNKIPEMIDGLCKFANSDDDLHPIIKGIIIHFMIGYIHPFTDGNGRLARSLFYWYVMKNGYPMIEYTAISKIIEGTSSGYGLAYQYTESDGNDLTYFLEYNTDCLLKAVKELETNVKKKIFELKNAFDFAQSHPEIKPREAEILNDYVNEYSPFSIKEIERRYGIAYQTAREYVMHMEDLGLVQKIGKERKKALYIMNREKVLQFAEIPEQKQTLF